MKRAASFAVPLVLPTCAWLLAGALASQLPVPSALAAPASAAPAPSGVDPEEAFNVGKRLYESGDYATALPLFQKAWASSRSPNARLYIARCLRELGRLSEAYTEMSGTVRDAMALAEKEPRYVATRNTAAAELALVEAKVGRIVVALDGSLTGARVTVNDAALEPSLLGQPVAVAPGKARISAAPPAGEPITSEVDVAAGGLVTVTLSARAGATQTTTQAAATSASTSSASSGDATEEPGGISAVQIAGIAVALVGVAGFVTFGVERAQTDSKIATLEDECGPGPCTDPAYADVVDSGKTAEAISMVGLVVGIAGVLAGTGMLVFGGSDETGGGDAAVVWEPAPNGLRVRF